MGDLPPTQVITFLDKMILQCLAQPQTWVLCGLSLLFLLGTANRVRLWEVWLLYLIGFAGIGLVPGIYGRRFGYSNLLLWAWTVLITAVLVIQAIQIYRVEPKDEKIEWGA